MTLTKIEFNYLKNKIRRDPTSTELQIINAEWSEHCSYKSSKNHLKILPVNKTLTRLNANYDAGIVNIDNKYIITIHIESHNHPSSIEPFCGAATGVGGIIRDILATGTRPIALLNGLRFGSIKKNNNKWIFKNVINGIGHYGNCVGVPTVGGEVEFDECYDNYALVDVMCIGLGKKSQLIKNHAKKNDLIVLLGNFTGKDGIGGSQFASMTLQRDMKIRSVVQIPDPFIKKLIVEAILELGNKYINAMKDLGGGGLSCAVSELADSLSIGVKLYINHVHTKESNMTPGDIMTSESQERMLLIVDKTNIVNIKKTCKKFNINYSVIGKVTSDNRLRVYDHVKILANLPVNLIANAPLLNRSVSKPNYLKYIQVEKKYKHIIDFSKILMRMIINPNIASKDWVYTQYDQEVGAKTVIKPGYDAAVLKLDNYRYISITMDGNPKHCYIDPMEGVMGCFDEACRNVICTGATPIGMINHLQFGNPEKPEIFWTFLQSIKGLAKYANYFKIPCIGGKVSFYNEIKNNPIKPTPVIGVIGILNKFSRDEKIKDTDQLIMIGNTNDELGGSEYFYYIHKSYSGTCPKVDFKKSKNNMDAVLCLLNDNLIKCVHDCSKGGLAIALSKICMINKIGCRVSLNNVPRVNVTSDKIMFSESHSRYLVVVSQNNLRKTMNLLHTKNIIFNLIGQFKGTNIIFEENQNQMAKINVINAYNSWISIIRKLIDHG